MGFGWDHNYNRRLVFYQDGTVGVTRGDGACIYFKPDGRGGYTPLTAGVYDVLRGSPGGNWTLTAKEGVVCHFDPAGRLARVADKNGATLTLFYNAAGQLTRVSDPFGRALTFTSDSENRLTAVTDPLGRTFRYTYDAAGDLIAAYKDGELFTAYGYDPAGRLTEVQKKNGAYALYGYDGDGNRVLKVTANPSVRKRAQERQEKADKDRKENRGNEKKLTANGGVFFPAPVPLAEAKGGGPPAHSNAGGNGQGNGNGNSNGQGGGNSGGHGYGRDKEHTDQGKHLGWLKGKHLGWYRNGKLDPELLLLEAEVTRYINDVSLDISQVLMTADDAGNYLAAYNYGLDLLSVAHLDNTRPKAQEPLYYLHDVLGSIRQLVTPAGNQRAKYDYDPFGLPLTGGKLPGANANVLYNPYGFTGEQHDYKTGFIYLRARYLRPGSWAVYL